VAVVGVENIADWEDILSVVEEDTVVDSVDTLSVAAVVVPAVAWEDTVHHQEHLAAASAAAAAVADPKYSVQEDHHF